MKTMKKTLFLTTMALLGYLNANAQFSSEQIVASNTEAQSIHAVDIDGDGDMDLVSADSFDGEINWFRNDGEGNFSAAILISDFIFAARWVYAADIDGDGDTDVLSASFTQDEIVWYENINGLGNFSPKKVITANADGARSVFTADIDGDGDIDVLSASATSASGAKLAWYENTDGLGNFGAEQIVQEHAPGGSPSSDVEVVSATDIDNDGDIDIVSVGTITSIGGYVSWHENTDGLGNFGAQQIISTGLAPGLTSLSIEDIDSDGDMDLFTTEAFDGKLIWYENTDGLGNFSQIIIEEDSSTFLYDVQPADLDNDGFIDLVVADGNPDIPPGEGNVHWLRNTDGLGNFSSKIFIAFGTTDFANDVSTADLDNDGDIDVLLGDFGMPGSGSPDGKFVWYENLNVLSVSDQTILNLSIYPNPTSGVLTITSEIAINQIEIYNSLGQLVLKNSNQNRIDISSLNKGVYFCKIKNIDDDLSVKKVLKN